MSRHCRPCGETVRDCECWDCDCDPVQVTDTEDLPGGSDPQVEAGVTRFRPAVAGLAGVVAPDEQSADGPAR